MYGSRQDLDGKIVEGAMEGMWNDCVWSDDNGVTMFVEQGRV